MAASYSDFFGRLTISLPLKFVLLSVQYQVLSKKWTRILVIYYLAGWTITIIHISYYIISAKFISP